MRYLLWGIAVILMAFLIWNPFDRNEEDNGFWPPELKNMKADLMLKDIRYRREINGKTAWTINASQAKMFEQKKIMEFCLPEITFFADNGNNITVKSANGTYMMDEETVTLHGNVTVKTADGTTLRSDFLRFSQKDMTMDSNRNVKIGANGNLSVNGTGLVYDIKDNILAIDHPVTFLQ